MKDLNIRFPQNNFEKLIKQVGWTSTNEWINFWNGKRELLSINDFWGDNFKEDWIWGLALPLLSRAYFLKNNFSDRKIIGISALPGTGKTTLGKWLEKISLKMNFKISVISMDDFYLASEEMKLAIKNNPWNVSRGFPGSHSIDLINEKLTNWKYNGELNVPVFDKSLRNGLGDRSHWRMDNPDLLILEGWFLGVNPLSGGLNNIKKIDSSLSDGELSYRYKIQDNLGSYRNIWDLMDDIWHLKPLKFEYMNLWKSSQEKEMLQKTGSALKDKNLENFLRMLNVSIPHKSFDDINSDFLFLINQNRDLLEIRLKNN